ncbi:MAG: hypothetical protein ABSF33_03685 [Acidimicrobiales bacterium]
MGMHPFMAEQMVGDRMSERQRAASASRRSRLSRENEGSRGRRSVHPHRGPARLVGGLLIAAGRRLAGPDALSAALDASRVEHGRTPA